MFNLSTPKAISLGFKVAANAVNRELSQLSAEQAVKNETETKMNLIRLEELRMQRNLKYANKVQQVVELVAELEADEAYKSLQANLDVLGIK